jgi:hypothetical protein
LLTTRRSKERRRRAGGISAVSKTDASLRGGSSGHQGTIVPTCAAFSSDKWARWRRLRHAIDGWFSERACRRRILTNVPTIPIIVSLTSSGIASGTIRPLLRWGGMMILVNRRWYQPTLRIKTAPHACFPTSQFCQPLSFSFFCFVLRILEHLVDSTQPVRASKALRSHCSRQYYLQYPRPYLRPNVLIGRSPAWAHTRPDRTEETICHSDIRPSRHIPHAQKPSPATAFLQSHMAAARRNSRCENWAFFSTSSLFAPHLIDLLQCYCRTKSAQDTVHHPDESLCLYLYIIAANDFYVSIL